MCGLLIVLHIKRSASKVINSHGFSTKVWLLGQDLYRSHSKLDLTWSFKSRWSVCVYTMVINNDPNVIKLTGIKVDQNFLNQNINVNKSIKIYLSFQYRKLILLFFVLYIRYNLPLLRWRTVINFIIPVKNTQLRVDPWAYQNLYRPGGASIPSPPDTPAVRLISWSGKRSNA